MGEFIRTKSNYEVLTGSHAIEVDPPTQCVGNDGDGRQSQDSLAPLCLSKTRIKLVQPRVHFTQE